MDIVVLIARIVFAALFLGAGVGHLTQTEGMAGFAQVKGVPSARLAVQVSGVIIIVGGLFVLLGVWADLGALLLMLFLLSTALVMHAFWKETDATAKMTEQNQFLKDLALAGAALGFFALFAYAGTDLGLTFTGPLFSLG